MNKEVTYQIDNSVLNIFTSISIDETLKKYHLDNYLEVNQIHSNIVHIVDDDFINNKDGDALITNKTNIPLLIKTADCIPVVLYDKENKVISAIHSGWKGTLNNITINALNLMKEKFNSKEENIYAYLYPSIRQCHFEIEYDVYSQFKNKINNIDKYTKQKDIKYYLDLQEIIKDNLKEQGITNIIDSTICTYCNHDTFHSYRYNHTDKRNILLVMIKE